MTKTYNHQEIEQKWQKKWHEDDLYRTSAKSEKPKYYVLDMFPYPSGAGLHVGHPKGYIATDVIARQKMMQGYNVLHPMGWDAFGLPAENFALKNKVHPAIATAKNVETFKKQLECLGFTYDWSREINTTDPKFYQWTQWIFLKMYDSYYDEKLQKAQPITKLIKEKFGTEDYYSLTPEQKVEIDAERLAFEDFAPINWCPSCKTGLANEDLEDGKCERCGSVVEKKPLRQWNLRITKYADRLLADLKELDWEPFIKTMHENWIGRSEGATIRFALKNDGQLQFEREALEVFTTRADTLFGVTYVVVAPEWLEREVANLAKSEPEAAAYVKACKTKSEIERTDETREKTGVKLQHLQAINPVNGQEVPVWVADYVLGDYGTGAVMAVPAHDERDWEFAKKYDLPVKIVVKATDAEGEYGGAEDGVLVNSGKYDGLESAAARRQIVKDLGKNAELSINYKLREWVFSRQRYWGEPIPMIHCPKCGHVPVPESELPLELPAVEHYEPSGTGESPLVNITEWVETKCPHCGGPAKRETNTMPQWAGSSWYYLRYLDPDNEKALVDADKERYMMPVDFYVGGAEHATRHLIYARFYHKFLYDLGVVHTVEPFTKLQHVGLILAEDGRKMSKRWGNVINPDEIVAKYGADSMRVYEMFMGPFGSACAWNTQGLVGVRKFLVKVWNLRDQVVEKLPQKMQEYTPCLQQTIAKVTSDIAEFKLNTVVSSLMILTNKMQESKQVAQADYEILLQMLAPLAPHVAEELWADLGHKESIFTSSWPQFDASLAVEQSVVLPVQVNGKLRAQLEVNTKDLSDKSMILSKAKALEKVRKYLDGKQVVKEIYVPSKIVNFVVR
ncbi:leucine--tRNA ligase [bacterium]|nr:leucine--tRNA ligase [bacterium]